MLPCNIIIQETGEGQVEVAAINPVASMTAIDNESLKEMTGEVQKNLLKALRNL